jgi:DNA-binding NarL/FixJ family response regulator
MNEQGGGAPIRIVLVDDHVVMREGTQMILERAPGNLVVGAAATGAEAIKLVEEHRPDVLLLDLQLPDMSGVEVARHVRASWPSVAVLMLTGYIDGTYVPRLLQLGVRGYMPKTASSVELIAAVRAVAAGRTIVMSSAAVSSLETMRAPLTAREREVLQLLAQGLRNSEMADRLTVSIKTVEHHVTRLLAKMGVQSRSQAIIKAREQGLVAA